MIHFAIDDKTISRLAATRQGRVSVRGFHYQAGYAIARLASMQARRPVLDLNDTPIILRYDWGEDLDEIDADGRTVFTQCKCANDIGQPAKLAGVLIGLAPKWLWTPTETRQKIRFRIVCSDPRFQSDGPIPLSENDSRFSGASVRAAVIEELERPPSARSDRALWFDDSKAFDSQLLAEQLWRNAEVLYVRDQAITDSPAGVTMLWAEQQALELLVTWREIAAPHQAAALGRLRSTLHGNVITFDPISDISDAPVGHLSKTPRVLTRADTHAVLFGLQTNEPGPRWFRVVGRSYLEEEARKPKEAFIARPPEWADVIHGPDAEIRFVERDLTEDLVRNLREHVLNPIKLGRDSRLRGTCVLGAPGAGKTTLARRAAALLIQENAITVADPGPNLPKLDRANADSIIADLARLSVDGRPVLLILDDPFFAESGWDAFLLLLARSRLPLGFLAVSPDFLFEKFGIGTQHPEVALIPWTLPRPSLLERATLLEMYGRKTVAHSTTDEDFLVLSMEAATGEAFAEIITRLWKTLNDGKPIDSFAHPKSFPWPVRAYLVTCFFQRIYERCPEAILRESLANGIHAAPEDYEFHLRHLALREGWRIFSVDEPGTRLRRISGRTIGAAHHRIAREAWNLRPGQAFDVSDWVIPASIRARLSYDVGLLASALVAADKSEGSAFAYRVATQWSAARDVRTADLATLSGLLATGGARTEALRLEPTFRERASTPSADSWLAILQLWYLSSPDTSKRTWPEPFDISSHIEAADLSIAPSRLSQFLKALGTDSPHRQAIVHQLLAGFDEELSWRLDNAALLVSLLSIVPPKQLTQRRLEGFLRWLGEHPDDTSVRSKLLAMIGHRPMSDLGLSEELLRETVPLLDSHHGDRSWEIVASAANAAISAKRAAMEDTRDASIADSALHKVEESVNKWFGSVGLQGPNTLSSSVPTRSRHAEAEKRAIGNVGIALLRAMSKTTHKKPQS